MTPDRLNDAMPFDHVIRVHANGSVTDEPGIYAPELYESEVSPGWTLLSGYSGQYGYSGPIMHPSEYIGGGMARDILAEPGVYVALADFGTCGEDCEECGGQGGCDEPSADGWAVARKDDAE